MACKEKIRLIAEYETETSKFAATITELQQKMGVSSQVEYTRLKLLIDDARVKSEQARLALEQHIAKHKC